MIVEGSVTHHTHWTPGQTPIDEFVFTDDCRIWCGVCYLRQLDPEDPDADIEDSPDCN